MPHPSSILPEPYRPPTREQIERARAMYLEGFTVSRCLAAADMSLGTLYYWLDGGPREALLERPATDQSAAGQPLYPPIPRRRVVVGKRRPPLSADRVSLVSRLWRTAERQTRDIEERLSRPGASSPERERDVRMLATLVRSLRDLSAFDAGAGGQAAPVPAAEPARDIEEIRESLLRKLNALVAEQEAQRQEEERAEALRGALG